MRLGIFVALFGLVAAGPEAMAANFEIWLANPRNGAIGQGVPCAIKFAAATRPLGNAIGGG
jgi:hypothetical protein